MAETWQASAMATAARFSFAAVLLPWFLISAATKLQGSAYAMGPDVSGTWLTLGAYYRLIPWAMETDGSMAAVSLPQHVFVHAAVTLEFVLPLMVVFGLATRFASGALIALIAVMSLIDVYGHGAPPEAVGALFDASPYDQILDLRLLWIMLLAIPLTHGAGQFSTDGLLHRIRRRTGTIS